MIAFLIPALLMGLAGGAHCISMCGGVAATACGTARGRHAFAFHLGRVLTYSVLGALVGVASSLPSSFLPIDVLRVALRAFAAALMLGVGLHLAGATSILGALERIGMPLWKRLAPVAKRLLPVRTSAHGLLLGAIWGFVPCGLLYGALSLAASAGSVVTGTLTMAAFGVGTLPVMTLAGAALGGVLRRSRRVAGVFVVLLAVQQAVVVARSTHFTASLVSPAHACCHGGKP